MDINKLHEGKKKSTLDKKWDFDGFIGSFRERIHSGKYEEGLNDKGYYLLKETGKNSYQPVSKTVFDYFMENKSKYSGFIEPENTDISNYVEEALSDKNLLVSIKRDFEGFEITDSDLLDYLSEYPELRLPKNQSDKTKFIHEIKKSL